jgi:hypothetical protein
MNMTNRLQAISILPLMLAAAAFAQSTGSIVGTVTDSSGAVVPDCRITATETETKLTREAACSAQGYYVVSSVRPTTYSITVESKGFRTFTQKDIALAANQTLTVDASLQVGETSDTIVVAASAVQVDTTTASIGEVVDEVRINELPLDGRNPAQLIALVAGTTWAPPNRARQGLTMPVDVEIATNGARGNQISYQLDGANNNDGLTNVNAPFPFPDALQEFSVQTANYSAQFGRNAGAAVNAVTKSGTNQLHGDAFEYVRNYSMNAGDWASGTQDTLKRNQYGFTVGGPLFLPKIYDGRNRTFFFLGYQGTQIANVVPTQQGYVPTVAEMNGDFSQSGTTINDPITGQPFANNQIPMSRADPSAQLAKKYWPATNDPSGLVYFSQPSKQSYSEWIGRLDQSISAKDSLNFRYYLDEYTKQGIYSGNDLLTVLTGRSIPSTSIVLNENHVFSPTVLNEARIGFSRINGQNTTPAGIPSMSREMGVKVNQDPLPSTIDDLCMWNHACFSAAWPVIWTRNVLEFSDDFHWVHGRHDIAVGTRIAFSRFDDKNTYATRPEAEFSGDWTGYDVSDFFLGKMYSFSQMAPQTQNLRSWQYSFYAQDHFRVTPRLTLDLGLRYEPFLPYHEKFNRVDYFNPSAYASGKSSQMFVNAPAGLQFPGDSGFPSNGVNSDMNNFAPRVGFAYDVFGTGKTSIRGGAGMFYDAAQVMAANMPMIANPFTYSLSLNMPSSTFHDPYAGMVDPFPISGTVSKNTPFPKNPNVFTYDPFAGKYITPVSYNWNLTLEHQFAPHWLARASYVGTHGSHQLEVNQMNPGVYIPGSSLSLNQRRIYQGFGSISALTHDVNSSYNGLQMTLSHQFAQGFTILANYTYSKSIDDAPIGVAANSGTVPTTLPIYDPNFHAMDRGPSEYDYRHVANVSWVWQSPKLSGRNKFVRTLARDWELSGILSATSGAPVTIFSGLNKSQTGNNADRAVYVSGQSPYSSSRCDGVDGACKSWLNLAAFQQPVVGSVGNVGKSAFRAPGSWGVDAAGVRSFSIKERLKMQLRADFFNLFNHPTFGAGGVTLASPYNFGITRDAQNQPRTIQLAAKVIF